MTTETDVAVIGLGAMGSASLWRLAQRGARVVGFEQFEPGHDRGSSHGESRIIRTAYFEGPEYVPLVQRAFELWRELEDASRVSLLTMTGALMMGRRDSVVVSGTLESVRRHDLTHDVLDPEALTRRYPQFRISPDEIAVYEEAAGFLRPEAAVKAMVAQSESLGATVVRGLRVEGIDVDGDGVRITAGEMTCRARHVIVSVGAWLAPFLPSLGVPLHVERQVLVWFPLRDASLFAPRRFPVYMRESGGGHLHYGFPTLDGKTVKVAAHHEGAITSADTLDRETHADDLEKVACFVRDTLPDVTPTAVRSQVCMYTNTPDEHFLIGAAPGTPNVTVLGGFSGHGFKFASVVGDVAADLAVAGHTAYPIALFAPDRFAAGKE